MKIVDVILKRSQVFEEKAAKALDKDILKVILETLNQEPDLASELWEFYVNTDMVYVTFPEDLYSKVAAKTGTDIETVQDVYFGHDDEIKDLLSSMYGDIQDERYRLSIRRGY